MKNIVLKLATRAALAVTVRNVNSTCTAIYHQAKLPTAALKLKK